MAEARVLPKAVLQSAVKREIKSKASKRNVPEIGEDVMTLDTLVEKYTNKEVLDNSMNISYDVHHMQEESVRKGTNSKSQNRKPMNGDSVKVLYEEDGWTDGIIISVGRGNNWRKITVEFKDGTRDKMEYDGVDVIFDDALKCSQSPVSANVIVSDNEVSDIVDLNLSTMKVAELRKECLKRGLNADGKKSELVTRMKLFSCSTTDTVSTTCNSFEDYQKKAYSYLKITELREECLKVGLSSSGRKADLITRLNDYEKKTREVTNVEKLSSETIEFTTMKVAELRSLCKQYGLDSKGLRKAELIDLLNTHCNV